MSQKSRTCNLTALHAVAALSVLFYGPQASTAQGEFLYHPVNSTMSNKTIILTGHDMTIEQVIQVARYGAKVQLSPEARQREEDKRAVARSTGGGCAGLLV